MPSFRAAVVLGLSLCACLALADAETVDAADSSAVSNSCSCFRTNGSRGDSVPNYFTNYVFIDFRSLMGDVNRTARILDSQNDGEEDISSGYFTQSLFTNTWDIESWNQPAAVNDSDVSTYEVVNSPQNVFIDHDQGSDSTFLTLRTTRNDDFQSCAELDTPFTVYYASLRIRARITGDAGAVAGMFFYRNDTSESDVEILTRDDDRDTYHASNQPTVDDDGNEIPGSSDPENIPATADYTQWNTYRLDWIPGLSAWAINGEQSTTKTYGVPVGECSVNLNMWGNGGEWSGIMEVGDAARMDIEWVEIVYNATLQDEGCGDGMDLCDVDAQDRQVGTLNVVEGNAAHVGEGRLKMCVAAMAVVAGLVMLL